MNSKPLTNDELAKRRFYDIGSDDNFCRWRCQWNRRQFLTLYKRTDMGLFSLRFRHFYIQGINTVQQLDDALELLQKWEALMPPENL